MLFAFKRSKIAAGAVLAASVVIVVLIWVRDQGRPVYIPIIASLLMLAIGVVAARLLGNILSNMENTRYLGYLHMELDPQKFLEHYRDVPGRLKPGSRNEMIARSYLADGYWADGQFGKAMETIGELPQTEDAALRGLCLSKLCAYYLAQGEKALASAQMEQLDRVIASCRAGNPKLAANLLESLTLYRQYCNALGNKKVDTAWLERSFPNALYNIRRLELAQVMAMTALRSGDRDEAEKWLNYLKENGGKTFFASWAKTTANGIN